MLAKVKHKCSLGELCSVRLDGQSLTTGSLSTRKIVQIVLTGLVVACCVEEGDGIKSVKMTLLLGDKHILVKDMAPISTLDLITLHAQYAKESDYTLYNILVGSQVRVRLDKGGNVLGDDQPYWHIMTS